MVPNNKEKLPRGLHQNNARTQRFVGLFILCAYTGTLYNVH